MEMTLLTYERVPSQSDGIVSRPFRTPLSWHDFPRIPRQTTCTACQQGRQVGLLTRSGKYVKPRSQHIRSRQEKRPHPCEKSDRLLCLRHFIVLQHVLRALGIDIPVLQVQLSSVVHGLHCSFRITRMLFPDMLNSDPKIAKAEQ